MYLWWYQGYNVSGQSKFVMRFIFFECGNKIGAACAPLLFGMSGPRVTLLFGQGMLQGNTKKLRGEP
jgi:hypothetical protein